MLTENVPFTTEPPYRVERHPLGIGNPPPIRAVKVRPRGVSGELLTEDEQGVWAYVEYLEAKVRDLTAEVREDRPDDSTCDPASQSDGPQARAQAANATEMANPLPEEPKRAQTDSGATGGVLEKLASDAEPEVAPAGSLRDRVVAALLADPTKPNGAVALEFACSDEYVRRIRKELEASGALAPVPVRRSDGSLYSRTGAGSE